MTELTNRLIDAHLRADPTRAHAYHYEARYHAELELLHQVLDRVDRLLADAGHDPDERAALLKVLAAGPPDPAAAQARLQETAERIAEIERQPPRPLRLI